MKKTINHWRRLLLSAGLGFILVSPSAAAVESAAMMVSVVSEEEEKLYLQQALYIYKFTNSFTWPKIYLEGGTKAIDLCIIGVDTLQKSIDLVSAKALQKDNLRINVIRDVEPTKAANCNIAYVSKSHNADVEAVLAELDKYPILTVSEIEGFNDKGGIIEYKLKRGKLIFNINKEAVSKHGLKINPELLQLLSELSK